jgi:hypothetical protein
VVGEDGDRVAKRSKRTGHLLRIPLLDRVEPKGEMVLDAVVRRRRFSATFV